MTASSCHKQWVTVTPTPEWHQRVTNTTLKWYQHPVLTSLSFCCHTIPQLICHYNLCQLSLCHCYLSSHLLCELEAVPPPQSYMLSPSPSATTTSRQCKYNTQVHVTNTLWESTRETKSLTCSHWSTPDWESWRTAGLRTVWGCIQKLLLHVLKRHDQFVAFNFYCKIMLISISYNYCSVLTANKCFINWLHNVKRWMFIRIPTLSLKLPRVTPTLWPLPTGSRAPGWVWR